MAITGTRRMPTRATALLMSVCLASLCLVACNREDLPSTSFGFTSSKGDYIGAGKTMLFGPKDSSVAITGTPDYVRVLVDRGTNESWRADLRAPHGQTFHPGVYANAERTGFQTGLAPGIDISGNGRGCNDLSGQLTIYAMQTDSAGNLTVFDALVQQHCQLAPAVLTATIRLNAKPMSLTLGIDPGYFPGKTQHQTYDGSTSLFSLTSYGPEGLSYHASGLREDWYSLFIPPLGRKFVPGIYAISSQEDSTHARFDFADPSNGCSQGASGTLTINTITRDKAGNPTSLNAAFVEHCYNGKPALRGTIRFNA